MKIYKFLFVFVLLTFLFSCSSEEEEPVVDYSGTYILSSARDECPDPANDGTTDAGDDGICVTFPDEVQCYEMRLTLNPDFTFSFLQITRTIRGSIELSEPYNESGTYTVIGDRLITDDPNTITTPYDIVNNGQALDWIATITDLNCERIFRFTKQ